ncbi:MAG: tryptophan--tRNA ligase, partial [Nitrososphaerales archaeon]
MSEKDFIVTPWEVRGEVDYDKLIREFGTQPLDETILRRVEKHTGTIHLLFRRNVIFSHRDFDWILDKY